MNMNSSKVVVALSGGVDSAVTAALLQQEGAEVIGLTLRLKNPDPAFAQSWLCLTQEDEEAVAALVAKLGIEHHYLDRYPDFAEQVLRPSALDYARGRTPNPCCLCNQVIKFAELFKFADAVGAGTVATGHYARLIERCGRPRLLRGLDPEKDQSYFLYRLEDERLARLRLPLGGLTKQRVRELAREFGLPVADRPDSQDACFQVPGECFGETLRRLFQLPARPGRFLYRNRTVGRHTGIHQYTIGQRKGLNVALGRPAYIVDLDPVSGDIRLETDEAALLSYSFGLTELIWHDDAPPLEPNPTLTVRIRYRGAPAPARLTADAHGYCVIPDEPLRAVTPGQSAVFYAGELLLGGGVIA